MRSADTPHGPRGRVHQAGRRAWAPLEHGARYLTPTGRVCRLVATRGSEVTLAYEQPNPGSGPVTLGERFTLTAGFAGRTLVRVG